MLTNINIYRLFENLILSDIKLNEGLIMTHDLYESVEIINNFLGFDGYSTVNKNKIEVEIDTVKFENVIELLTILNNLGYYTAVLEIKINNRVHKFTLNKLKDNNKFNKNTFDTFEHIKIILEPKYDTKHKLNSDIIYHVTEERYLNRIIKNGLIAKSKNNKTDHPERIYFTYNIEDSKQYIKSKKQHYLYNDRKLRKSDKYYDTNFIILEVIIPDNLIFYKDPNFKDKGIYTYDNIVPKNIKVLE